MTRALCLYSNNDHPTTLKAALISAVVSNDIADFKTICAQFERKGGSQDDKSVKSTIIVPEHLTSTLNNLLDVAAEANNFELFDALIKLGAKPVHNPLRRSAYYWAFKHRNGKIIDRICNLYDDQALQQLHNLQLNAYHYYFLDEENSETKLQRLYNQLLNFYSSNIFRDDKKTALGKALSAYRQNNSASATINTKNAADTKIEITLTSAISSNAFVSGDEKYSTLASPYELLLTALEQEDYVTVKAIRRENLNELIDAIIDHNDASLLTLLNLTATEKFNYLKRLIDKVYYEQRIHQNTAIKIAVDNDEKDEKSAASPTPVILIVNSNISCKRLEKILSQPEYLSTLLQTIFTKNATSLLRTLIYLLVLKEHGPVNYFDLIPNLIAKLSPSTQSVLTQEFLLYSQTQPSISFNTTQQHQVLASPFEIICIADYSTHPLRKIISSYLTIAEAINFSMVNKNLRKAIFLANYSRPTQLIDSLVKISNLSAATEIQIRQCKYEFLLSYSKIWRYITLALLLITLIPLIIYLVTSHQISKGISDAAEDFTKTIDTLTQLMCDVAFPWFLNNHMEFIDPENTDKTYRTCNDSGYLISLSNYGEITTNATQELTHLLTGSCYEMAKQVCAAPYAKQSQHSISATFAGIFGIFGFLALVVTGRECWDASHSDAHLFRPVSELPENFTTRIDTVRAELKLNNDEIMICDLDASIKDHKDNLKTGLTAARDNLKTSAARLLIRSSPFMSLTTAPKTTPTSDTKTEVTALESVQIEMPRLAANTNAVTPKNR